MNRAPSTPADFAAIAWHHLEPEAVLRTLESDRNRGLSEAEAEARRHRFGLNRLPPPKKRAPWLRFLLQFHNLLIYVLLAAAAATLLLGDLLDTAVIVAVVVLNALIGFIQEGKAEAALEAVRNLLAPTASVLRDGRRRTLPAEQLVPGDIVLLQAGDKVPADLRLLELYGLRLDEAMLTGESIPVEKTLAAVPADAGVGDRFSLAFSGTLVTYGQGVGVVVATGRDTELGRISTLLAGVDSQVTPLLRKVEQLARWLTGTILGAAAATFLFGWLSGRLGLDDLFMAAVSLAVAAIPEGLPAVVTITLAVGVRRMAQRRAIVRKLPAVETLGSVTVICTDKTGTLTRNEMTVQTVATAAEEIAVSGVGYAPHGGFSRDGVERLAPEWPGLIELARAALLCNDAALHEEAGGWRLEGDPTEGALLVMALKAGLVGSQEQERLPRVDAIPFDSQHRFMATLHRDHAGHRLIYLKGAPEVVLERCNHQRRDGIDEPLDVGLWHRRIDEIAARGQRLLALAVRPVEGPLAALDFDAVAGGLTLLGVVGMIDPPRSEAIAAVERCQRAGIRVKMITGDHATTAAAVGAQLGIGGEPLGGPILETLDDEELAAAAAATDVFARASPEHKLRLVEALRRRGEVVAMTGDGVNDAPALKAADIGVAMGQRGTEAAKEAAEIVLADDNFATIATAVEEGRTVYDNLRKTILFALPTNGGQGGTIIAAILLGVQLPITPLQILWVNLVTAVTLALTLAFEPPEGDLMQRPPRPPREPLVTGYMLWRITYVSLLLVVAAMGIYEWELARGVAVDTARSAAVNALVAGEGVYLISSRFFFDSSLSLGAWTGNRYALWAIGILIGLQLLFTYAPFMQQAFATRDLDEAAWLRITALALVIYLLVELEKAIMGRRRPKPAARPLASTSRFSRALAGVWGGLIAVQAGWVGYRLAIAITIGDYTPMGLLLAAVTALLAVALLVEALVTLRHDRSAVPALRLVAPAALLAVAWSAPDYPYGQELLPWLVAACIALLALGLAFLMLARGAGRSAGSGER